MKKAVVLFIFLPFLFFSQSNVKYPALLWKISGKGLKKPSYLYGTMHVSNRVAFYLSEQFFEALKSVQVVGLETNPGEWLENMEQTGELSELSQVRSPGFGRDFYKSAFAVAPPEKRMLQGILSYDPDIINGLLYRQNKSRENFEENTYIDLFIYQAASKLNKEVISLENFARSEIISRLSALPDDETGNQPAKNSVIYTNAQKIEDAYRDGNLDIIDSLSRITSSRNIQKYLITERNYAFAATIDSVIRHKTLFSGIGAAHLPGNEGVIELLRGMGYSVEPVFPYVTKKSNAMREKLDKRFMPVTFSKQYASDSLFSVNLPGKLYPIMNMGSLRYDIHADMINGSFYTVVRLKHFAPLFNFSASQMFGKVDSLLFEHIPGKILMKKHFVTPGGIMGIEIVNRMRRGDEQHYHIYFTDLEMIMFKLGGKDGYASGKEARKFFSSIKFYPRNGNMVAFSPPAGGFSVNIPADYSYTKNDGSSLSGLVEDLFAYDKSGKKMYGLKRAVFNDFTYLEEDTFELNQLARNTLESFDFKLKPVYRPGTGQGLPSLSFSGQNKKGALLSGKIFIKGVHYYLIYQVSENPGQQDSLFFNSFRISEFRNLHPIKEITDREFYFKTMDEVTDNALSRFNEAYMKAYEGTVKTKKTGTDDDHEFRTGSKFYYSPSNNEYIAITYEKYNDYDYRNLAEITGKIEQSFRQSTSMLIEKRSSETAGNTKKYRYILKDTATSRALDVRIFFTHGMMHEITAPFDTTLGLQGWAKSFMDAFTPLDTVIGKDIFEYKFADLLFDISGTDSVKRQAAHISLQNSVMMNREYAGDFVHFISGNDVHRMSSDSRALLFVNGGTLESEKILPPYKELYVHYTDSFYLQLCLLKGLAYLQTRESYKIFYDLLLMETPLVGDENSVSDVFAVLYDSLELCRDFFPGMLALTKYDEYRDPVYALLAGLVNKKHISAGKYSGMKQQILSDAALALKRYAPGAGKSSKNNPSGNFDHLEKSFRELAESILGNLDGLSANNNGYAREDQTAHKTALHPLVNYACVLAPFHEKDAKVKEFITKLSRVKDQDLNMQLTVKMLKHNIIVNDTLIEHYSANRYTRAFFYSELEKESLENWFSKKYLSQRSLVESVLSSQNKLSRLYNNEKDVGDSLVFVKELEARNKYQQGSLFVYRNVSGINDDEQWSAVFVNNTGGKVSSQMDMVATSYYINPALSQEENLNGLLGHFAMSYRKRAIANNQAYD